MSSSSSKSDDDAVALGGSGVNVVVINKNKTTPYDIEGSYPKAFKNIYVGRRIKFKCSTLYSAWNKDMMTLSNYLKHLKNLLPF